MFAEVAISSAIALLALASHANAHGYLYEPEPTWVDSANPGWIVQIDYYWEEVGSGGDQVGTFKTMAEEKGMTVRDVVLEMVGDDTSCGNTLADADPKAVPTDGKAIWLGNGGGGFTHQGPCEIWIDDTMVLHGDNCENEYPGGDLGSTDMSEMPVDYSSCSGDCKFAIYWLAFQNEQWQAYINCVPLTGTGSSTTTTEAPASEATATDAPTTEAPATEAPATEAPATEAPATEAPAAEATETEAPATEAPATEVTETEAPATESPDTEAAEATTTEAPKCARRLRN